MDFKEGEMGKTGREGKGRRHAVGFSTKQRVFKRQSWRRALLGFGHRLTSLLSFQNHDCYSLSQ